MGSDFILFIKEQFPLFIYLLTLIVGIYHYRKYFDTELKFFPMIIAYTFFNELLGYFIRYSPDYAFFSIEGGSANDVIYNLYSVVFFGYFYYVYWLLIKDVKLKRLAKILAITAIFGFIINAFYSNPLKLNLYYATSYAGIILVFIIAMYFTDRRKTWKWEWEKYNLVSWVSFGLLAFYVLFPFLFIIGFTNMEIWEKFHFRVILRVLIVVMYGLFCIGFIKSRRRAFR